MRELGTLALDAAIDIDRSARDPDHDLSTVAKLAEALRGLDLRGDVCLCDDLHGVMKATGRTAQKVDEVVAWISDVAASLAAFAPGGQDAPTLVSFCLALHREALSRDRFGRYGLAA